MFANGSKAFIYKGGGYYDVTYQQTLPTGEYWQVGDVIKTWVDAQDRWEEDPPIITGEITEYTIPEFKPPAPVVAEDIYINDATAYFSWEDSHTPRDWTLSRGVFNIEMYYEDGTIDRTDRFTIDVTQSQPIEFSYTAPSSVYTYNQYIKIFMFMVYMDENNVQHNLYSDKATYYINRVRPPTLVHTMTTTEPYTTGTSNYGAQEIIASLYQGGLLSETQTVQPDSSGNWSMTAPTVWAVGYGDEVRYLVHWTDGRHDIYSNEVVDTVTGPHPYSPVITSNSGKIYINDSEVTFSWTDGGVDIPSDWVPLSGRLQGRTVTRDGVVKHYISELFGTTPGETSTITITNCPYYEFEDSITYRVQINYEDGDGNMYTIGSETTPYEIDEVKVPTITHSVTTTEDWTEGTCNVGDTPLRMSACAQIQKAGTTEWIGFCEVNPASDGTWVMDSLSSHGITAEIGDTIKYWCEWSAMVGTQTETIRSDEVYETITE